MIETTPVYPAIGIVTNCPPCASCGGPMQPDIVLGDLEQCATCGCRRMVPKVAAAANSSDTREALAVYAHDAWSRWMMYFFEQCDYADDGTMTVPPAYVRALCRLMDTSYPNLSEEQKDNDRAEADRLLTIVAAIPAGVRALFEEVLVNLQSTWLVSSESSSDREIIQDDIDDYRARLDNLLKRGF